ncbi:unnamed protein product [Candidula unifasciata]|uniref:Uncharacterized protein n=1 Tax=Candidula unifasciata TaxID=100452 RepID=A0A8S3ZLD0_9EUPU|nr:unnamed protein product [Candidula unifasciata]
MANQGTMERELLTCSICLDLLMDPKTLPCMHRFCESCLNGHIFASAARTSDSKPGFSCPDCREFIPAPDSSSTPSAWVGMFKTDFTMKSMVEVYESRQDVCAPKVRNPCPKHEDKEQELYCFDCSATVCHLCAVISHRACRQILTVTGAAQQRRNTWREYLKQIQLLISKALETDESKADYMNEIRIKKDCVEKQIKDAANKMRKIVNGRGGETFKTDTKQLRQPSTKNFDI